MPLTRRSKSKTKYIQYPPEPYFTNCYIIMYFTVYYSETSQIQAFSGFRVQGVCLAIQKIS